MKKQKSQQKIILTTGGTCGHITPAMRIASELIKKGREVYFITDNRFFEYQQLFQDKDFFTSQNFKIISIPIVSFAKSKTTYQFLSCTIKSFIKTLICFIKIKPDITIGFGSYVSFFPLLISLLTFKKIIIHEQNAVFGSVNKLFIKFAKTILLSFPDTKGISNKLYNKIKQKIVISGYPTFVTEAYIPSNHKVLHDLRTKQEIIITVTGGSQGAKFFSTKIAKSICSIARSFPDKTFTIYHQVRSEDIEKTLKQYSKENITNLNLNIKNIFYNLNDILYKADIAIIRGGAGSIIENSLMKVFSIIVPLPNSKHNHQLKNAKALAINNAAILLEEKNYKTAKLAMIITKVLQDATLYFPIITTAHNMFNINAPDVFMNVILYNDLKF